MEWKSNKNQNDPNKLVSFTLIEVTKTTAVAAMAKQIIFFKLIREIYQTAGIHPRESSQSGSYNLRNSFILIMLSIVFIVSTVFLLFDAKTIEEYGNSFYISTTVFLDIFMWTIFIQKMGDLFNLMDQMNVFGQKRRSKYS